MHSVIVAPTLGTTLERAIKYLSDLDFVRTDDWLSGNLEMQWVSSDGKVLATGQHAGPKARVLFHVALDETIWHITGDDAIQLMDCGRDPWNGRIRLAQQSYIVLVGDIDGALVNWRTGFRPGVEMTHVLPAIATPFIVNHPGVLAVIVDFYGLNMSSSELALFRAQLVGIGFEGPVCSLADGGDTVRAELEELLAQAA